jgi:uncharacterized protein (DUF362 family)/NAD-dependent dihydropyrimidine dehydrogenase PreA subunit
VRLKNNTMQKHKVSVVECNSYDNKELNKSLLESLKNIDFNFKKNQKILIKPNILSAENPDNAVTTHPAIIEELCKILKKYGSDIYIGDSSGIRTKNALKVSGIDKLSKYAKILNFDILEKKEYDLYKKAKNIPLPKILSEFDLIINMPKLKTHGLTGVTLSVKNLYGCIIGLTKSYLHVKFPNPKEFSRLLLEIEKTVKPDLNIIDGIWGLEGNGPGSAGTPIKSNVIIAGTNPYAVDIIASELMGFKSNDIYTNRFSNINKEDIVILGNNIKLNFKKPEFSILRLFLPIQKLFPKSRICFDKDKCIKCLLCEEKCPVKAININPTQTCNHKKCIRCLCCIEVCPNAAITLKEHWTKAGAKSLLKRLRLK